MKKVKVFLSYSHKDERLKEELDKHLVMLKRNNILESWNDRCINAGQELEKEILGNLKTADIILLLISPDFLQSSYCYEKEMKIALEKHKSNEAIVIPVILRKCDWKNSPLRDLEAAPKDGKHINSWNDQDEAFFDVKEKIESAINSMNKILNP